MPLVCASAHQRKFKGWIISVAKLAKNWPDDHDVRKKCSSLAESRLCLSASQGLNRNKRLCPSFSSRLKYKLKIHKTVFICNSLSLSNSAIRFFFPARQVWNESSPWNRTRKSRVTTVLGHSCRILVISTKEDDSFPSWNTSRKRRSHTTRLLITCQEDRRPSIFSCEFFQKSSPVFYNSSFSPAAEISFKR